MKSFLVKWLIKPNLEPVNPTLTLGMQFTTNQGVLRPLEDKIDLPIQGPWWSCAGSYAPLSKR